MILISPELLINYIYFKKRKVNLSVQLTILFGLKRFVGTDTLAKIASEAAAKSISEVKAVDIPEKNSSSSSFDGFSSQQLTTPGTDPTLPSNTHYVITNEKKKDVQEQHKQMQKQDYTAQASLKKAEDNYDEKVIENVESKDIAFKDLSIIPPPSINNETFIETGLQKHLLAAFDSSINNYVATHYLTSKVTAPKLCDKQLKIFQNEQENPGKVFTSTKTQRIVALTTPRIIKKEDVVSPVFMDKEYLQSISPEIQTIIQDEVNDIIKRPPQQFNKSGITKQDCINMCQEHDKIVGNKGKHPLSPDQIKQNEENKKKQQEKNKPITNNVKPTNDKTD